MVRGRSACRTPKFYLEGARGLRTADRRFPSDPRSSPPVLARALRSWPPARSVLASSPIGPGPSPDLPLAPSRHREFPLDPPLVPRGHQGFPLEPPRDPFHHQEFPFSYGQLFGEGSRGGPRCLSNTANGHPARLPEPPARPVPTPLTWKTRVRRPAPAERAANPLVIFSASRWRTCTWRAATWVRA